MPCISSQFILHSNCELASLEETHVFYDAFFLTSTCFYVNNDIKHNQEVMIDVISLDIKTCRLKKMRYEKQGFLLMHLCTIIN